MKAGLLKWNIKKLIVVLACATVFFSCKKYGDGYVMGSVIESTVTPASGVPVYVIETRREAKGLSSYFTSTVGIGSTNTDGSYKVDFKKLRGWKYSYKVMLGESDAYIFEGTSEEITEKKSTHYFEVYKKAYAVIRITKTTTKPVRLEFQVGKKLYSSSNFIKRNTFTDSLVDFVFTTRANDPVYACVKTQYVDENLKKDWCSNPQYIQPADTIVFSVSFE
jgi:hypothetical protein